MTTKILENDYFQHPATSRSDLLLLDRSPRMFRARKDGLLREGKSDAFFKGTMVDKRILSSESFDLEYVCQPDGIITPGSPQQQAFCDALISGVDSFREAYAMGFSVKGKSQATIDAASQTLYDSLRPYILFMENISGRVVYDGKTEQMLVRMENSIATNKNIQKIWELPDRQVQFGIVGKIKGFDIELKALIDAMIIDHEEKIVYCLDLKSTAKPLNEFHWSYKKYEYDLQQFLYTLLLKRYIKDHHPEFQDYLVEIVVLAVEKCDLCEAGIWKIEDRHLERAKRRLKHLLELMIWHKTTDIWDRTKAEHMQSLPPLPGFL